MANESKLLILLLTKNEMINDKVPEIIPFMIMKSKAKIYLPNTTSFFPIGKVPYSLLRLFFSYTEKNVQKKGAEMTTTSATVKTGICETIAITDPIK